MTGTTVVSNTQRLMFMDMQDLSVSRDKDSTITTSCSTPQPCLCFPKHHQGNIFIPGPKITEMINNKQVRWGATLACRGEIIFIKGFENWSRRAHGILLEQNLKSLANIVHPATMTYQCPISAYRALCEIWCPATNTFITSYGEVRISLWEICEISGLSIIGDYYE